MQLGYSTMALLHVRVTYSHSAFPASSRQIDHPPQRPPRADAGEEIDVTSQLATCIETTATAMVRRHSPGSMWSPRPTAPEPNPLFEIVARQWSASRAAEVMHLMLVAPASSSTSRSVTRTASGPGLRYVGAHNEVAEEMEHDRLRAATRTAPPPPVPRRRASLVREVHAEEARPTRRASRAGLVESLRRVSSTAGRPWAIDRCGLDNCNDHEHVPSPSTCPVVPREPLPTVASSPRSRKEGVASREGNFRGEGVRRERSVLRTRRSMGTDASRASPGTTPGDGRPARRSRESDQQGVTASRGLARGNSVRGKRESGRWGWAGWW